MSLITNPDDYKPKIGELDYPQKYDDFITEAQNLAQEIFNAREGQANLLANLRTYAKYILANDIDGNSTYKCINMPNAEQPRDYVTYSQALLLSDNVVRPLDLIEVGSLEANDYVAIDPAGTSVVGRPAKYTVLTASDVTPPHYLSPNDKIGFDVSGGGFTVYLPLGPSDGTMVSFADINGSLVAGITAPQLTIRTSGGDDIQVPGNEVLEINYFPHVSFDLVWAAAPTSRWVIQNLQR